MRTLTTGAALARCHFGSGSDAAREPGMSVSVTSQERASGPRALAGLREPIAVMGLVVVLRSRLRWPLMETPGEWR